ncbi:MAG: SDR family NAD(P)-dependent oxidoreductase [Deltaproteobacteria bacterium]|nr:SDR family NAD(P)-dependent oxidoreductase [Deltaproteobacteria bacterium]
MAIASLRDKRVVVTGAASGIGRSAVLAFGREGAHLVALDRDAAGLAAVGLQAREAGLSCETRVLDVTDADAWRALAATLADDGATPHVLVNNAGIGYFGLFLESDLAHWRRVLDVNLMGVVHGCHAFLPSMLAAGGPRHVLNVASSAGNFPVPSMAAYAASKFAVNGFTEVLRMELAATNVRFTTVCPGVIDTPIVTVRSNVAPGVSEAQMARLQAYYRREGCSPDVVAADMVRAVGHDVDMLLTGPAARLVYHLRRISLRLARAVTLRFARQSGYLA